MELLLLHILSHRGIPIKDPIYIEHGAAHDHGGHPGGAKVEVDIEIIQEAAQEALWISELGEEEIQVLYDDLDGLHFCRDVTMEECYGLNDDLSVPSLFPYYQLQL